MNHKDTNSLFFMAALLFVSAASPLLAQVQPETPAPRFDPTFRSWARVLAHCATPEGFRYDRLPEVHGSLVAQVAQLGLVGREDYDAFSRPMKLAFLINAHNVHAVRRVARRYPIESIEETALIGSALGKRDIYLLDRKWSLKRLRAEIMGDEFRESRAIFAINWAMKGCAPLAEAPATEANLEELLNRQTRRFIRDERYQRYEPTEIRYRASPLLKEYRELIERDFTTLWVFVQHFAEPKIANAFERRPPKFKFGKFDDALNDLKSEESG